MQAGLLAHKRDGLDWRLRKFRDSTDNHAVDPNWDRSREKTVGRRHLVNRFRVTGTLIFLNHVQ